MGVLVRVDGDVECGGVERGRHPWFGSGDDDDGADLCGHRRSYGMDDDGPITEHRREFVTRSCEPHPASGGEHSDEDGHALQCGR